MIGLIASVTVLILDTSMADVYSAILAAAAFVVLYRFHGKLTVLYVGLGCGRSGRWRRRPSSEMRDGPWSA